MKVGIIGAGAVGSTAAYATMLMGAASEVVLVDVNRKLAEAQAEDILEATPLAHPLRIRGGDYAALAGADIVVLCCGASGNKVESRLDLLAQNAAILRSVVPQVALHAPATIVILASNPVDILVNLTCKLGDFQPGRVFGTGTIIDSARFRASLGQYLGVSAGDIRAYVLGEHGDSEVLIWSSAAIGGMPLEDFAAQLGRPLSEEVKAKIDEEVRRAGYRVLEGKGYTNYAIGTVIAYLVKTIRDDEQSILPLSAPSPQFGADAPCLSLPRILGAKGIKETLRPALSDKELQAMERSAETLRRAMGSLV